MPSAYPPRNTGGWEGGCGGWRGERGWRAPSLPGREMTKELRRGTVARRMGAHTFHGCFRDKRYAGCLDTRENELREEQSAFPGSLVLQLHANPFAYVVQTTTMSRALPSPFFFRESTRSAIYESATVLAPQFLRFRDLILLTQYFTFPRMILWRRYRARRTRFCETY